MMTTPTMMRTYQLLSLPLTALVAPLAIVVLLAIGGCQDKAPSPQEQALALDPEKSVVTVIVRGPDLDQEVTVSAVKPGATVESVMRSVKEIPVTIHGSGVTAFVSKIGEIETNSTQGWTYKVNGVYANRGIGSVMIVPPATLTWTFGTFEETAGDSETAVVDDSADET